MWAAILSQGVHLGMGFAVTLDAILPPGSGRPSTTTQQPTMGLGQVSRSAGAWAKFEGPCASSARRWMRRRHASLLAQAMQGVLHE